MNISRKLSVVTITYQDPKGLKDTLTSLLQLKELGIPWEVIIVDGSPKVNEQTIKHFSQDLPIQYIEDQPKGVYVALNKGASLAGGEYLWFLNGGDALTDPAYLREVLNVMNDEALDIYCSATVIGSSHIRTPRTTFLRSILGKNLISHPAMIYRLKSFRRVGDFSTEYKIASDYDHHFRCFFEQLNIKTNPTIMSKLEPGGISNSDWKGSLSEMLCILRKNKNKLTALQYTYGIVRIYYEFIRITLRKLVINSPVGPLLKKFIQKWNDLKY